MSQFPFSFELRAAGVVSFNSSQKQMQVLRLRLAVSHPSGEDLHPTNKDPFVGAPDLSPGPRHGQTSLRMTALFWYEL